ncbi:hypothetical protein [uncultured Chitinophaga sp.]|uniref:carboxylesterase family protein n=1 Tax=uncultured Chitinophaga sp. TaxID=339340 RepID=UPI0025CC78F5|nr:hypothetical protein [uncultured Chitinophaga sp.]
MITTQNQWFTRPMTLATFFFAAWISITSCGKENSITPITDGHGNVDTTGTGGGKDTTSTGGGKDTTNTGGAKDDFAQQTPGISVKTLVRSAPAINKQYVLYTPSTYNTDKTKKWPLIIFLHGVGERGSNINSVKNVGLAKKLANDKDFQFVMIAPQCNIDSWWDMPSLNTLLTEALADYNVDPSRVYLTGLSMGGYGTWNWGALYPDKFAAIVPICGATDYPDKIKNLKNTPVWAFHNANDPTVGVEHSRNIVAELKGLGNTRVKYTENATGGHDAWTKAYNTPELYTWLLQYKK